MVTAILLFWLNIKKLGLIVLVHLLKKSNNAHVLGQWALNRFVLKLLECICPDEYLHNESIPVVFDCLWKWSRVGKLITC